MPRPAAHGFQIADVLNLAGLVTVARLPLAVAFPLVAADPQAALLLYTVASLSDCADGIVARATGTCSPSGATLDGVVDKIFHVNAAWALVLHRDIPVWWLLCWFSRELVQAIALPWVFPAWLRGQTGDWQASVLGKLLTWVVIICFFAAILDLRWLATPLTPVAGALGLASAALDLRRERRRSACLEGGSLAR
jgi:phosphatidylglycerophosphate synthase